MLNTPSSKEGFHLIARDHLLMKDMIEYDNRQAMRRAVMKYNTVRI